MAESDLDSELENLDLGGEGEEGGGEEVSLDDDLASLAGGEGEEGGEEMSLDDDLASLGSGESEEGAGEEAGGGEGEDISFDDELANLGGGESGGEGEGEGDSLQFDDDLSQLEESMGGGAPAAPAFSVSNAPGEAVNLDFLLDVKLDVTFEVGRAKMMVSDLLTLGQGSVIELHRLVGEELDLLVNGKLIAKGEVVVVNEKFGCKITEIVTPEERVKYLGGL